MPYTEPRSFFNERTANPCGAFDRNCTGFGFFGFSTYLPTKVFVHNQAYSIGTRIIGE
jgi:hypothetical protein